MKPFTAFGKLARESSADMTRALVLLVLVVRGVLGTFPAMNNPPPIPAQRVRSLDLPPGQYYVQEDYNERPPLPNMRDGLMPPDATNDQGWFVQERQIAEPEPQGSRETFDRYFQNGDVAIGPVATPMPDDTFLSQPSNVASINDGTGAGSPDVWIIARRPENDQYVPERWVQYPNEQVVEVVRQDSDPPVATDLVKSYSVPQAQGKVQVQSVAPGNLVQQVFLRQSNAISPQRVVVSQPVVAEVPSVKQYVDTSPQNFKQAYPQQVVQQVVQQQVVKNQYPAPPPQVFSAPQPQPIQKQFTLPPPPAPPVKGDVTSAKFVSAVPVNPGPNVLVSDKSGQLQQLRHIWVPTSSRTGRFVTVPVSGSVKAPGKGLPINANPISVSDTWVLKTDGPLPSFEQKSLAPQSVIQSGKVILQDTSVVQVNQQPQVVSVVDSPKNFKSLNAPLDIWPVRNDIQTSKVLDKSFVSSVPALQVPQQKTSTVVAGKSLLPPQIPLVAAQKSIVNSAKVYSQPPQLNAPVFGGFLDGKPCPIAPQKSIPAPKSPIFVPPPISRIVTTQSQQPLTRIIRINRYPTGSYYLLNQQVRPNVVAYPNSGIVQQSKTAGVVRLQTKPLPLPLQPIQSKQPFIPPPKLAGIPPQQAISGKRLVIYSLPQQLKAPVLPQKSPSRLVYPALQRYRYLYPLNGYNPLNGFSPLNGYNPLLKPSPLQVVGPVFPPVTPSKLKKPKKSSSSSSSESSSSSSESSEEKKEGSKEEVSESEVKPEEPEEKKAEGEPAGETETEGVEEPKEEAKETEEAAEAA